MTNVPQPTFGPNGFIAPAEGLIFNGVMADIQAAFGGNLNPDPTTPQGQLAVSWTAATGFANGTFCLVTTQFDPAYAEGRYQDAIARIYFLERNPAEPTAVVATCTGLPGTVIPVGALAQDADGNNYVSTAAGTIGAGGTVEITFATIATGPIACPPGALNTIYRAIPGWDSITNAAEGVLGQDVESRNAFEARRAASVAINAVGTLPAIKANVLNVSGVLDAYVTENDIAEAVTIGDVTLAPNSLYVCVAGGAAADVAGAIWRKKAPGCAYTGTTTVAVADNNSGYSLPLPTYSVKYTVATGVPIFFSVVIENSAALPSDAADQIKAAIVQAFAGNDGGARAKIGAAILASRYYSPVASLGAWAAIISIQIGLTDVPASFILSMGIDQVPTIDPDNIAVTTV